MVWIVESVGVLRALCRTIEKAPNSKCQPRGRNRLFFNSRYGRIFVLMNVDHLLKGAGSDTRLSEGGTEGGS